jgi:WD40 repeat protein
MPFKSTVFSNDGDYVFDIANCAIQSNPSIASIAVSGSNQCISIFDEELTRIYDVSSAHNQRITDLCSFNNLLISSSLDGFIKIWDMRDLRTPSKVFKTSMPLNCASINASGTYLSCGSEYTTEAKLFIFDIRNGAPVKVIEDAHNDDISTVKFHPSLDNVMISGSTDKLICVFDFYANEDDDFISNVIATDSSVQRIGFCGPDYEAISCITHIETFSIYSKDVKWYLLYNLGHFTQSLW